jgi:hypothetical protein
MVEAQTKAKEEVVKGTETALKKFMNKSRPASAPSLIVGVIGQGRRRHTREGKQEHRRE